MSNNKVSSTFTPEEIEEIQEAFSMFDTNGEGSIDPKVLKSAMVSMNFKQKSPIVFDMICQMENYGRNITFEEFLEEISKQLGNREDREGIDKIFDLFDEEKKGVISVNCMRKIAKELGENLSPEEITEMVQRAASNGQEISRDDFYKIMIKKTF
jgi:Ca2+-binding EF-hand superfamily protein